jgi:hypothetical protein
LESSLLLEDSVSLIGFDGIVEEILLGFLLIIVEE